MSRDDLAASHPKLPGSGDSKLIRYAVEPALSASDFIDVMRRSGLAARRPVGDRIRIERMLSDADLIVTARDEASAFLVGVSRALTDFSYCCYLSDLAVDATYQMRGIGRGLIDATHREAGPQTTLVLVSAPDAVSFYESAGFTRAADAFLIAREM